MPYAEPDLEVQQAPVQPSATQRGVLVRTGLAGLVLGIVTAALALLWAPALREGILAVFSTPGASGIAETDVDALQGRLARLEAQLNRSVPRQPYLIVSTTDNRFRLMQDDRLLREGLCATGSRVRLEGEGEQQWTFRTPRGPFRILKKTEKPVWNKPDWAFVEEGRPIPPPGSPERLERGSLGDYSLSLGDGYLIHGTLYQRLLGMPVTHGCVRLGDADLRAVYTALRVGAPVFIY